MKTLIQAVKNRLMQHNGPDPRDIPPLLVEAEIAQPGATSIRVILNEFGDVVTVTPGGQ